jgi:hypothetical protein
VFTFHDVTNEYDIKKLLTNKKYICVQTQCWQATDLHYTSNTKLNRAETAQFNILTNHSTEEATEYFVPYCFVRQEHG